MMKYWKGKAVTIIVTLVAVSGMLLTAGCSSALGNPMIGGKPKVEKKEKWTEVNSDIYVFTSDFYLANMTLVTSGDEAVLIDTGMDEKDRKALQEFISDKKLKLKDIIITHLHEDHSANIMTLREGNVPVVTPKNPAENATIELGDKTLNIIPTEGHYEPKGHISVELKDENILVAGDVICNNIIPPIAAGGDINDLLNTLRDLKSRNYSLIIPGHGEIADNDLIFKRQFEYLENAKKKVEEVIASNGGVAELKGIKLVDCIEDTSYLYNELVDYWHEQSLNAIYFQLKK